MTKSRWPSLIVLMVSLDIKQRQRTALRSCDKVEVAVPDSPYGLFGHKATSKNIAQELCES